MLELIQKNIEDSIKSKQELLNTQTENIQKAGEILVQSLENGKKILFCGNGGSAADAQHIAAELLIRFKSGNNRAALPALSLSSNSSALTACGNDYGYNQLFSRQVEGLGQENDALVAITTSGNSQNIIQAIQAAHDKKMKIIVLTGDSGGDVLKSHSQLLNCVVCVPSKQTARIQECHILVGHILCSIIEKELFDMT